MFRYYQISEKTEWKIIKDSNSVISEVLNNKGIKMTVLALSEDITEDTVRAEVKYKGPFYADIDSKEDIQEAARSVKELRGILLNRAVPEDQIQMFASGSKGFHIIVHEKNFSTGRSAKNLPKIYQEMALTMYVPGLDMQVYSMGKGVNWRLENVKRSDGNYRVRVDIGDVESIIEKGREVYNGLVSSPRTHFEEVAKPEVVSTTLEALFIKCKDIAGRDVHSIEPIADDKLKETFKDELPQCIIDMREGKLRKGANFNKVCLTVATFATRSGMSWDDRNSLASRLAENCHSASYDSKPKRVTHLQGLYKYLDTKPDYGFSCVSARGKVNANPCEGCALAKNDGKAQGMSMEELGIAVMDGSYFRLGKSDDTRLTTFTISQATKLKGPSTDDPHIFVTKAIHCEITLRTGEVHTRVIHEPVWKSKSAFLGVLEGIEGAVFLGSDLDVQKIKYLVFEDEENMEEVIEVDTAGIIISKHKGMPVPVYVEPNFSVNRYGVVDSHVLTRDIPNPPHMTEISVDAHVKEGLEEAFGLLMSINHISVVSQLLGWFAASHLKAHIQYEYRQFPLVNLWGNAGSGKTRTADMFMWLSGAGSKHETLSLSLPHATKFPLVNYVTSTTTVPRILEEFNKARISNLSYNYAHEIMKSAFNAHPVSRGVLAGGSSNGKINAITVELKVTSPLVYISEQPVDSPPLRQRSLSIGMDSKGRDEGKPSFVKLEPIQQQLEPLAKLLALAAVKASVAEVSELVDSVDLSEYKSVDERPRFSMQIVLAGLAFLKSVLVANELATEVINQFNELERSVYNGLDSWVADVTSTSAATEVDQVMEDFALMAHLHNSHPNIAGLERGDHYFIHEESLFINLPIAHALYKRFKRSEGSSLIIESPAQMMKLLRTESYFVADQVVPDFAGVSTRRRMVELSMRAMKQKGIEVSLFED